MRKAALALLTIVFVFGVTIAQEKAAAPEKKAVTETVKKGCCGMEKAKGESKECCGEMKHARDGKCCAGMNQAKAPKAEKPTSSEAAKKQEPKAPEAK